MKKFLLVLVLIIVGYTLNSCEDPTEQMEDEQTTQTTQSINHDELGGDGTEDDGDIDMENAG